MSTLNLFVMDITYAQLEDMFDLVPSLTERTENQKLIEAGVQSALIDASRLFETETFVTQNFYRQTDGIEADRLFYPNGTAFWRLPPFAELISITDSDGELVDTDYYKVWDEDFQVQFKWYPYYCGQGLAPITIRAKWGFRCVPDSVRVAVKHYAGLNFLTSPLGRKGLESGLTERQETRLRQTYNRIASEWQLKIKRWKNIGVA